MEGLWFPLFWVVLLLTALGFVFLARRRYLSEQWAIGIIVLLYLLLVGVMFYARFHYGSFEPPA